MASACRRGKQRALSGTAREPIDLPSEHGQPVVNTRQLTVIGCQFLLCLFSFRRRRGPGLADLAHILAWIILGTDFALAQVSLRKVK
jgi:hypothetical protein